MFEGQRTKAERNAELAGINLSEYLRRCEEIAGSVVVASGRVRALRTQRQHKRVAGEKS